MHTKIQFSLKTKSLLKSIEIANEKKIVRDDPVKFGLNWIWVSAFATSIEPDQSAHLCSVTGGLNTVGWPTSSSHLDISKLIMDYSAKTGRWIIPFKKFGMVIKALLKSNLKCLHRKTTITYVKLLEVNKIKFQLTGQSLS